jgi:hypothetical protein
MTIDRNSLVESYIEHCIRYHGKPPSEGVVEMMSNEILQSGIKVFEEVLEDVFEEDDEYEEDDCINFNDDHPDHHFDWD